MTHQPPRRSPSRAWAMWALVALFYGYAFFQRVAPSVMTDALMADFGVSALALGGLSAAYFYAYAAVQIPVGLLLDRFGPRRVLSAAAGAAFLGALLFSRADGATMATLGRALIGAGVGFAWVGGLMVASQWLPRRLFGMVSGLALSFGMVGAFGGQVALAMALRSIDWRTVMDIAAVFCAALAALMWLALRDRPAGGDRPAEDGAAPALAALRGVAIVLSARRLWLIGLFAGLTSTSMLAYAALWGAPYLTARYGLDRDAAALALAFMLAPWGLGGILAGYVEQLVGGRKGLMVGGVAVALALFVLLLYGPDLPLWLLYAAHAGAGLAAGVLVLAFTMAREVARPQTTATAYGFINGFVMMFGALGQHSVGAILDARWDGRMLNGAPVYDRGDFELAFSVVVAALALGVAAAAALPGRRDP